MAFKFENYKTEAAAKEQLDGLLPTGISLEQFITFMEGLGAECQGPTPPTDTLVACYYRESGLFVRTQWIVSAPVEPNEKIGAIRVKRGFVGT